MTRSTPNRKLGYSFRDPDLLQQALTHRSFGMPHNERLEFLGDALLNCIIALELFSQFPDLSEGGLSRARANLVNQDVLSQLAQQYDVGTYLRLGEGEVKNGGRERPSTLANALEAIFAAIYLDSDFSNLQVVVHSLFQTHLKKIDSEAPAKDPKTLLQEYLQARKIAVPIYKVVATLGDAHQQQFEVECDIPALGVRSQGRGSSRRGAEQEAAKSIYRKIIEHERSAS